MTKRKSEAERENDARKRAAVKEWTKKLGNKPTPEDMQRILIAAAPGQSRSQAGGSGALSEPSPALPANVKKVLAPLVGVFYRAPAPGAPPFCETGGTVTEGQVLCILEAMKLMNEIVSEFDGKIAKICVNDGDLVTLNQELMWIET